MCGISAVVTLGERSQKAVLNQETQKTNGTTKCHNTYEATLESEVNESLNRITHRGPDARGIWMGKQGKVALGHCRLSIVDLSTDGNQPFHSPDDTIHCVVNGEIYEYERIRAELISEFGYEFKSHSDSEVVVALYKNYGLSFLSQLRGEFALCLYDEARDLFIAARDRYGIKPLFWTVVDERLLVASEIKAFLPLGWKPEWDVRSIFDAGWAADARTTFKGVQKVRPGQYLILTAFQTMEMRQYWDMDYPDKHQVETRTEEEMIAGVRERLVNAVRLRLRADVPVGIYLSGGIDSSAIAGIITHLVKEEGAKAGTETIKDKVCSFSIAFDENSGFDEGPVAARTAEFLGIKNIKKHMDEGELARYFEIATYHCEHSNFDLNYIGKFALSEVTRENGYKVVLTGEGSDELFGGYIPFVSEYLREPDHAWPHGILHSDDKIRQELLGPRESASKAFFKSLGATGNDELSNLSHRQLNGTDIPSGLLVFRPPITTFSSWVRSIYHDLHPRDTSTDDIDGRIKELIRNRWHPLHSGFYIWNKSGLAHYLLSCLGDRVEMAHSVEARTPFLDHHFSEYVNGLPPSMKVRCVEDEAETVNGSKEEDKDTEKNASKRYGLNEKWILREATRPFITDEIYKRRKHTYRAPITYLAGGPLHTLMQKIVTKENITQLGFLDWDVVDSNLQQAFPKDAEQGFVSNHILRSVFISAQLVILGQKLGVKRADLDIRA